jgi:uncharacterized membrane protein
LEIFMSNNNLVSAIFDSRAEAERAVSELRANGVSDSAISIIAQHDGTNTATDGSGEETKDFIGKTALGAGAGTLLGIAALAIPGVGPLVAAGAIATAAIPGAALTGAALGAAAGGISAMLTDHGVDEDDARYYEERLGTGGVFVSVDTARGDLNAETVRETLYRSGGHSSTRAKMDAAL